jgi:UDP-glucuronate decarboxylase
VTGPVNLGNPHEVTILELAETIRAMTGSRSEIVFRPLPQDDPRQRCPEITKARELLGWAPTTPLAVGLQRTIDYFDDLLRRENHRGGSAGGRE